MKRVSFIITIITLPILLVLANDSDWTSDNWGGEAFEKVENNTFEEVKIKNRSKKEYEDKVYKYITGDYEVKNNEIELATVKLNDNINSRDVKVNVLVDGLKVEGDEYHDSIDIKRNRYKNFVNNDENRISFFEEDTIEENGRDKHIQTTISNENSRYSQVKDEDISEIETIDLREKDNIKEVNVFMEDVKIIVD